MGWPHYHSRALRYRNWIVESDATHSCTLVIESTQEYKYFPRPKHRATARCEVFLSMYIIPTPWSVAGPHGQLASSLYLNPRTDQNMNILTT